LLATTYLLLTTAQFLADYFSHKIDLASLERAARLQPANADFQYQLGRYYLLARQDPAAATEFFKSAVTLNPHRASYWLDLSKSYLLLGNTALQKDALEHAIDADPTTPDVAWEAAQLYRLRGENDQALNQFRVVLENDPSSPALALESCWRIRPDTDALLRNVIPRNPAIYSVFLAFLISRKETTAAAKVWEQMAQLGQPAEKRYVLDYVRYLIGQHEIEQSRLVWRQASTLSGLSQYQPSPQNLVVNGDFSQPVLNGGFDWLYQQKSPDVTLALDPDEHYMGQRSLSITFDSPGIEDAGIRQLISVEPGTRYGFSAYFEAKNIEGAGGPRFVIQDHFSGTPYYASDALKDADVWKPIAGTFQTGPETNLLELRIQRDPPGNAIRGKLWLDDVRLQENSN
jgi:tetratricopeptide (TPR) repeat protein